MKKDIFDRCLYCGGTPVSEKTGLCPHCDAGGDDVLDDDDDEQTSQQPKRSEGQ